LACVRVAGGLDDENDDDANPLTLCRRRLFRSTKRSDDEMKLQIVLAAAVAMLAAVPFASAEPQTTLPGIVYTIPAVLTDKGIELTHTQVPRGVTIRYAILNRGTRPYSFQIWKAKTRPIPPNGRARLRVNWDYRGRFLFRTLYRGKPAGPRGSVTVF
jgi:hypothetical protein